MNTTVSRKEKLTVQVGTRIFDNWADEIDAVSNSRAEFIREAILEKLTKCEEIQFNQEVLTSSKKTKFSSKTQQKTNVIGVLCRLLLKSQIQKKTDSSRSLFAVNPKGNTK